MAEPLGDLEHHTAEEPAITLPIRLLGLEDVEARYANLLHVNFDRAAFSVTFSQFMPPLLTGPEDARQLADQGYLPAKVVTRLVFTPLMVEQTIDLLRSQLDRYREQDGGEGGSGLEEGDG